MLVDPRSVKSFGADRAKQDKSVKSRIEKTCDNGDFVVQCSRLIEGGSIERVQEVVKRLGIQIRTITN